MSMGKVIQGKLELKTLRITKTFVGQGKQRLAGCLWEYIVACGKLRCIKLRSPFSFLPENKQALGQSFVNSCSVALWCSHFFVFTASDARFTVSLTSTHFNCSGCSVAGACQH